MKRLVLVGFLLAVSMPVTALNINTPTADVSEACPSVMNSAVAWLKRMFFPNPSIMN